MLAYCRRCKAEAEAAYRHPGLRRVARIYTLVWVPFLPLFPIIAADYFVMLPMTMVYLLGFGPVYAILSERPTCGVCGAYVEPQKRRSAKSSSTDPYR